MTEKVSIILITGLPGVGKTTIIKKLAEDLIKNGFKCKGFYTEEVRNASGSRKGFDVITFDGKRDILARDSPNGEVRRPKIGKYSVYTDSFEELILPSFDQSGDYFVIDEIGKMELLSKKFENKIRNTISEICKGKLRLVATIPCATRATIKIVEDLKSIKYAKIFEITKENRNTVYPHLKNSCLNMNSSS